MASISEMNSIDKRYAVVRKPTDLVEGSFYSCEIIKKIDSRDYGTSYMLESNEFKMFLPKRYNELEIMEFVRDRRFRIIGWMKNTRARDKKSPLIEFAILTEEQLDDDGHIIGHVPLTNDVSSLPHYQSQIHPIQSGDHEMTDQTSISSTSSSSLDEGRLAIVNEDDESTRNENDESTRNENDANGENINSEVV